MKTRTAVLRTAALSVVMLAASCNPGPGVPVPDDDHTVVLIPPTSISYCTPETCGGRP